MADAQAREMLEFVRRTKPALKDLKESLLAAVPRLVEELAWGAPQNFRSMPPFQDALRKATEQGLELLEERNPEWFTLQTHMAEMKSVILEGANSQGSGSTTAEMLKPLEEPELCCICQDTMDRNISGITLLATGGQHLGCINGHFMHADCFLIYLNKQGKAMMDELQAFTNPLVYLQEHQRYLVIASLQCPHCRGLPNMDTLQTWIGQLTVDDPIRPLAVAFSALISGTEAAEVPNLISRARNLTQY
jgi:hypothetical protein